MARTYIALGSNIEPQANLRRAVRALAARLTLTGCSRVYRTPPWGLREQPPFLNAVLRAETDLAPQPLLELLLAVELTQGRTRGVPNAPRTLDLDLLLYGDLLLETPHLTVPHPRLHERAFVLVPLCDLAPDLRHPLLGRRMDELLAGVDRTGIEPVALTIT